MENKWISFGALGISALALYIALEKSNNTSGALESRIEAVEAKNAEQEQKITDSTLKLLFDGIKDIAYFNGIDETFQPVRTNYGVLLILYQDAQKIGNGYKLTFKIGNPYLMKFNGLKGKIEWEPKVDYERAKNDEEYSKSMTGRTHSKDFTLSTDIYAGAWNTVTINISPATEEDIGVIRLKELNSDSVLLRE